MASINLYKISENNQEDILEYLNAQYSRNGEHTIQETLIDPVTGELLEITYQMTLYFSSGIADKELSWNWLLTAFVQEVVTINGSPKSVVLVLSDNQYYAITFGHSYFKIDQFSEKEWAFDFARRLLFTNVKTTAITNPNSQRNKTVNTYLDYENLDFGSGEALTKIKAKIQIPEGFNLFLDTIEIGNSIRLQCEVPTLKGITEMIGYIENIIRNEEIKVKIPFFKLVKDLEQIHLLKELLKLDIENNMMLIDFSEYQILATRVVFHDNYEYEFWHKRKNSKSSEISLESARSFLVENDFSARDDLLDIRVVVYEDGRRIYQTTIEKLIFYTNEDSQALLSSGFWYIYNEDYLQYLKDSISEIQVEYEEEYNYRVSEHTQYLEQAFQLEHAAEVYRDLTEDKIREKIKNKYYKEWFFNEHLVELGFLNFDRDLILIGKHKLEVMDLYKDNSMYAVKFGNSSGKLCYAVDQSIEAIKAYHRKDIVVDFQIEKVYLWLVLERNPLPLVDGQPDINALEMLILKNKLDQWKKEVRLLGYQPRIRINYKIN